jgi:hypothetical protein
MPGKSLGTAILVLALAISLLWLVHRMQGARLAADMLAPI